MSGGLKTLSNEEWIARAKDKIRDLRNQLGDAYLRLDAVERHHPGLVDQDFKTELQRFLDMNKSDVEEPVPERWKTHVFGSAGHATTWITENEEKVEKRYRDGGEYPDDPTQRRPCTVCSKSPTERGDDACIDRLPKVKYACCGHGKKGYVALEDERTVEFYHQSGDSIRKMLEGVLIGDPELPEGFSFRDKRGNTLS